VAYSYIQIANPNASSDPDGYGSQARANAINQATMQKVWEQKRQKAIEEAMSQPGAMDEKGAPNELIVKRYLAAQGFGQTGYGQGNANTLSHLQAQGQGAGMGIGLKAMGVEPHLGTQQRSPAAPDTSDRFLYPQQGDTALPQEDKLGSILRGKPITKQETTTRSTQAPNDIAREDATTVRVTAGAPKADRETFTIPSDNVQPQPTREPQSAIERAAWSAQMPGGAQGIGIAAPRPVDVASIGKMSKAEIGDVAGSAIKSGIDINTADPKSIASAMDELNRRKAMESQRATNSLAMAGKMVEGKLGEALGMLGENQQVSAQNRIAAEATNATPGAIAANRAYTGSVQGQAAQVNEQTRAQQEHNNKIQQEAQALQSTNDVVKKAEKDGVNFNARTFKDSDQAAQLYGRMEQRHSFLNEVKGLRGRLKTENVDGAEIAALNELFAQQFTQIEGLSSNETPQHEIKALTSIDPGLATSYRITKNMGEAWKRWAGGFADRPDVVLGAMQTLAEKSPGLRKDLAPHLSSNAVYLVPPKAAHTGDIRRDLIRGAK
jgi:hypothetical protein